MGLIVHLSDLHLGPKGADIFDDDDKANILSDDERRKIRDSAEKHFKKLITKLQGQGRAIDAIVISGDVTVQGSAEGYEQLEPFLVAAFGGLLPSKDRIIVVPGNHDVSWYAPDASVRYENFKKYCVDVGYVTPPLEDIDLHKGTPWAATARHTYVHPDEGWAVIPINSAHWSGTRSFFKDPNDVSGKTRLTADEVKDRLETKVGKDTQIRNLLSQVLRLGAYDIARVSTQQMEAVRTMAQHARTTIGLDKAPLLLSAIHHQILPVNDREELKSFEAISNLGAVREMLRESGMNVLFHGHKHASQNYWDVQDAGTADGRASLDRHEMMIISGATIGGQPAQADEFANIIEITPGAMGHDVSVTTLGEFMKSAPPNTRGSFFDGRRISFTNSEGANVEHQTFDEAYARLAREADAHSGLTKNLVVRIADGTSFHGRPPADYPADAAGSDGEVDAWFKDVARWWQLELDDPPQRIFTHGRRLKRYGGQTGANQIKRMADILGKSRYPTNGRAMAVIINPVTDLLPHDGGRPTAFPAFGLVQLHLSEVAGTLKLNAVGYFRKQEMRYWWPVNVAELHAIMTEVAASLKKVEIGSITTVAGVAVWEENRTRVAVPYVDRQYLSGESGREQLMRAAADLCAGSRKGMPAASIQKIWGHFLADIVPAPSTSLENLPIAVEGVRFLASALNAQSTTLSANRKAQIDIVTKSLKALVAGAGTLEQMARTSDPAANAEAVIDTMDQQLAIIRSAIDTLLLPLPRTKVKPKHGT